MKQAIAKTIPTELVASTPASDRAPRIVAYHNGSRRSAAQQIVYAFLAGVELNAQKGELAHGQFMKWREENIPQIPHRTATLYMNLAEALQPKISEVANFDLPRLQLSNGEIREEHLDAVSEAVSAVTSAKTITDLYREHNLAAKPVHQSERARGTPAKPTAEDQKKADLDFSHLLLNHLRTWRDKDVEPAILDMLLDEGVAFTNHIRQLKHARRQPQSAAKSKPAAPARAPKKKGKK